MKCVKKSEKGAESVISCRDRFFLSNLVDDDEDDDEDREWQESREGVKKRGRKDQ